jgi:hypothetical protein
MYVPLETASGIGSFTPGNSVGIGRRQRLEQFDHRSGCSDVPLDVAEHDVGATGRPPEVD